MSKVVKGIGRAISKVVKGVGNVVKKVAKSKLGKILLTAAAVYFGGAALIGSMGGGTLGVAATSGGFAGAAQGVAGAWNGLINAVGMGAAAEGAGAVGSSMGGAQGVTTGLTADVGTMASLGGEAAVGQGLTGAGVNATGLTGGSTGAITSGTTLPGTASLNLAPSAGLNTAGVASGLPVGTQVAALSPTTAAAGSKGLLASAMSSPYTMPAVIMGSTQLLGGAAQGHGAQKQQDRQIQLAADERARYERNLGTLLYRA